MQPISEETIEQIDSFVFQLSKEQLEQWYARFKKQQYNLFNHLEVSKVWFDSKREKENLLRLFMVLIRSYNIYEVELPVFSKIEVNTVEKNWNKIVLSGDNNETIGELLVNIGKDINQPILIKYFLDKVIQRKNGVSLFRNIYEPTILATLTSITILLNREYEKLLAEES